MHSLGWRSVYCMPEIPAFRGTAPINLSDRLSQVLRWAVGSLEILFSRHCPIWYTLGEGKLKGLQRIAYINSTVYPFSSIPLIVYCVLPAICLLTDKFITPSVMIMFFFPTKKKKKKNKDRKPVGKSWTFKNIRNNMLYNSTKLHDYMNLMLPITVKCQTLLIQK